MRKHYRVFIISILVAITATNAKAQILSVMGSFSPSTSTLIGSASRIGFDNGAWSTYYMRYNDCSYFCDHHTFGYWAPWAPAVTSTKVTMQQDFVITDFKKFLNVPGYIGSCDGIGMYGYSLGYNLYNYNYFLIAKLPVLSQLNRIAEAHPSGPNAEVGMKFFAVGEKTEPSYSTPRSYLLEFYYSGTNAYLYAPLAYNTQSNEFETADDVITIGQHVVFATRDTRSGHAPVNLRISDTNNVLSYSSTIGYQWRFMLPNYEIPLSELRLLNLDDKEFVLAYTILNTNNDKCYLCVHRIDLPAFLANNNSIISHEINISRTCSNLIDVIYKPNAQTLVVLLDGEEGSKLFHLDPYSSTNDIATELEYSIGHFYSIDTLGASGYSNDTLYIAMGGNVIFTQSISNGINIEASCLNMEIVKMLLRDTPVIKKVKDLLDFFSDNRNVNSIQPIDDIFYGTRTCNKIIEN